MELVKKSDVLELIEDENKKGALGSCFCSFDCNQKFKKQADELDKQIQEVRDQIVGFVGTNEAIVDKDMKVLCSYKYQHGRSYIDKEKLMLIHPEAYQQCLAEYQGTRVLRLSRK